MVGLARATDRPTFTSWSSTRVRSLNGCELGLYNTLLWIGSGSIFQIMYTWPKQKRLQYPQKSASLISFHLFLILIASLPAEQGSSWGPTAPILDRGTRGLGRHLYNNKNSRLDKTQGKDPKFILTDPDPPLIKPGCLLTKINLIKIEKFRGENS